MEFFSFLNIPLYILPYFLRKVSDALTMYICLGIAGGLYLVCLIFGGIGLYTMAKKRGIKYGWIGFLPFGNTYLAGKLAGEVTVFGKKMKRAGLYAMLLEILFVAVQIFYFMVEFYLQPYYETVESSFFVETKLNETAVPLSMKWMITASKMSILSLMLELVLLWFMCDVYIPLFRKYSPQHALAMSLVSILFPIRAFTVFAVRNHEPVDYNDYVKKRMENLMRQSGMDGQNMNRGGTNEAFGEFSSGGASSSDESPFEEFNDPHNDDN